MSERAIAARRVSLLAATDSRQIDLPPKKWTGLSCF
jgi:hypothetical protein